MAIAYTVTLPGLPSESLHVDVDVEYWPADSVRFLAPPIYADNPLWLPTAPNFRNLAVRDSAGNPLAVSCDSLTIGEYPALRFSFARPTGAARIQYDVGFSYDTAAPNIIPVPGLRSDHGILLGNYFFIVPLRSTELVGIWRDSWSLRVDYRFGQTVPFYGDPADGALFRTVYELLFSTSVLGGRLLWESTVGQQACRIIDLSSVPVSLDAFLPAIESISSQVLSIFPKAGETPLTGILGALHRPHGGLEGTWAYSVLSPFATDTMGVFNMVLAHEMIHSWIGVRVGDTDDPWWKEGTATYLGFLIPAQIGLCKEEFVQQSLLRDFSQSPDVLGHSMSEEYVRVHLFSRDSLQNCENLAYGKGAQFCMLLDRRIRDVSNGAATLAQVLGRFCRVFDGKSFCRADYVGFLEATGAQVADLFSTYADQAGFIPDSVLIENYNALAQRGALGIVAKRAVNVSRPIAKTRRFPFWAP